MNMNIIRYDTFQKDIDYCLPTIFLAGPTTRGNQTHLVSWRKEAVELFEKHKFRGNIILPEFPSNTESDQNRYDIPYWEFEGLEKSHVILFWIPRTKELIGLTTNFEIGYWMARDREKIVYGRPNDAYRIRYIDIMWVEDYKNRYGKNVGIDICTSLKSTVEKSIEKANILQFVKS